jgi:hypothetical protein
LGPRDPDSISGRPPSFLVFLAFADKDILLFPRLQGPSMCKCICKSICLFLIIFSAINVTILVIGAIRSESDRIADYDIYDLRHHCIPALIKMGWTPLGAPFSFGEGHDERLMQALIRTFADKERFGNVKQIGICRTYY